MRLFKTLHCMFKFICTITIHSIHVRFLSLSEQATLLHASVHCTWLLSLTAMRLSFLCYPAPICPVTGSSPLSSSKQPSCLTQLEHVLFRWALCTLYCEAVSQAVLVLTHIEFSSLQACGKITQFHPHAGIKTKSPDLSKGEWAEAKEPIPAHTHVHICCSQEPCAMKG